MPCIGGILVACLGMGAFCCLKVVVDGCWLSCSGQCLVNGLPQGFPVAF